MNICGEQRLQQLRNVVGDGDRHRYLIHDRDRIFSRNLDDSIRALGVEAQRSPVASPKANAMCERVIGTIRRGCLDWMIPLSEAHLRSILKEWTTHYNKGRPHSACVRAYRIHRRDRRCPQDSNPDIDWRRVCSCLPNRCWEACITSICSQSRRRAPNGLTENSPNAAER